MYCYNCGVQLSEQHDFCTGCGADVGLYKKIMYVSNRFYNDGLEKASVRDLTGAITSLRQCLKFNKNHVEARNLLGLVYFETGEVVAAMSEWVISKNLRPEKNIADDYIGMLQANATRLDSLNQTIKKYNQAYAYCVQDSKDLAVLQLKKVLSLNPKFIKAHQLLALLYMDSEQWERAQRELKKCADIDRNNTMTLRYMKEVERMLEPDDNVKQPVKRKKQEAVRYQSDNEIIIQPMNVKEPKSGNAATLFNVAVGLVIGLAACYFLVVPGKVSDAKNQAQQSITEIANQSAKAKILPPLSANSNTIRRFSDIRKPSPLGSCVRPRNFLRSPHRESTPLANTTAQQSPRTPTDLSGGRVLSSGASRPATPRRLRLSAPAKKILSDLSSRLPRPTPRTRLNTTSDDLRGSRGRN